MIIVITSVSMPGGEGTGTPIFKGRGCMLYLQGVKKKTVVILLRVFSIKRVHSRNFHDTFWVLH